ncbi:hypothetical protein PSELUDRAFT_3201 [Vogesella sp. LIG4]|nr:hypothetical protein PSELUDRAFT_3201 [Vogesella sp. LIG4]
MHRKPLPLLTAIATCLLLSLPIQAKTPPKQQASDEQIKQLLIQESIDDYPGNCPCPYNSTRNGSSCGKRSAYSRPGGYAPLCYKQDITPAMIRQYREEHGM